MINDTGLCFLAATDEAVDDVEKRFISRLLGFWNHPEFPRLISLEKRDEVEYLPTVEYRSLVEYLSLVEYRSADVSESPA